MLLALCESDLAVVKPAQVEVCVCVCAMLVCTLGKSYGVWVQTSQ